MVAAMTTTSSDTRLLQNIWINDVAIGGMTYNAAYELLLDEISISDERISIICADTEHLYSFYDFGANYNIAAALDEAMEHSRSGGFFSKLGRRVAAKFSAHHIEAEFVYNADLVAQIAEKISADAAIAASEPSYILENGRFVISNGIVGREADTHALMTDIVSTLETRTSGQIAVATAQIQPKYSTADFEAACDLIGSYQTPFNPLLPERTNNLTVASTFLDGSVVLPGETFSTSAALRPRTEENGYVRAGQILNGEPDSGIGGGICQISSTLYMAALHAEISVQSRSNHSLMVGYMQPATDAALAEGYIDLVLENNTNHPILIQSILNPGGQHIINIYGHESRSAGRSVSFESILLETRQPDGDKVIEDPFLPKGASQIVSEGIIGATYELHKVVTENGIVERVKVNTSNYRPLQRVVKVGMGMAN